MVSPCDSITPLTLYQKTKQKTETGECLLPTPRVNLRFFHGLKLNVQNCRLFFVKRFNKKRSSHLSKTEHRNFDSQQLEFLVLKINDGFCHEL